MLDKKVIAYLGRTPNFETEVKLRDKGDGVIYIQEWNISSEKAKPTDSQLNALSSQATALENNAKVDEKRRKEYKSVVEQLDQLYHDMTAGKLDATGEWHKAIKAVKDKYAKE